MKTTNQRIASFVAITFMANLFLGCFNRSTSIPLPTPAIAIGRGPSNSDYAIAQATMDAGQSQLLELDRRATQVSWDISQAANSAAQATQEYNQHQKMDLDYQATIVILNMAQAAATLESIRQQTEIARKATVLVESNAATATQEAHSILSTQTAHAQAFINLQVKQTQQAAAALTAYPLTATYSFHLTNLTQTVQVRAILDAQAKQAAHENATMTAYPLTVTPFAKTEAALLMQQYAREQQAFVDQIVIPIIPFAALLLLLMIILGLVLAYRRKIFMPQSRRMRLAQGEADLVQPMMIDTVIIKPELEPHWSAPSDLMPDRKWENIEIIEATEDPVAYWITELVLQLDLEGEAKQ